MKPEWHIQSEEDKSYQYSVLIAEENKKYIKASLSIDDIGHLLQGKHITLLFLNDGYEMEGMMDIGLTDYHTDFKVSDDLNELIINT